MGTLPKNTRTQKTNPTPQDVGWARGHFFLPPYSKTHDPSQTKTHTKLANMSCFGESVYASLAQMSVKGQADTLLNQHKVGQLDVFTSAFYTHPTFAAGFIRCGDITSIQETNGGTAVYQPPRSFDVIHDVFVCIELPGLCQMATIGDKDYEVLPAGQAPKYSLTLTSNLADVNGTQLNAALISGYALKATTDFGQELDVNASSAGMTFVDQQGFVYTVESNPARISLTNDPANNGGNVNFSDYDGDGSNNPYIVSGNTISLTAWGTNASHVYAAEGDLARYVDAAGQWAIQRCELEIGGSVIDTITSEWLYLNEELHGRAGRRLEDKIMKVANMHSRSTIRNRLYVPLTFWFTGGDLSRSLMTIALQLHRIDFRITYRSMKDLIFNYNKTCDLCYGSASYAGASGASAGTVATRVEARIGETVTTDTRTALTDEVRNGGNARHHHRGPNPVNAGSGSLLGIFGLDFHGIFLNTETRSKYLNLQTQQLFFTVQEKSDTPKNEGSQNFKLDFKNAVFEIIAAVRNKTGGVETGSPWKFGGSEPDAITGQRDDALKTLEFSLSSTPRTLRNLEAQYYRTVTQFQTADTMSNLKGVYYYPLMTREFLNGTRMVSGYINASKIDDLRVRYQINNGSYGGKQMTKDDCEVLFFCRAWNLLSIKNSMAGKMFQ